MSVYALLKFVCTDLREIVEESLGIPTEAMFAVLYPSKTLLQVLT